MSSFSSFPILITTIHMSDNFKVVLKIFPNIQQYNETHKFTTSKNKNVSGVIDEITPLTFYISSNLCRLSNDKLLSVLNVDSLRRIFDLSSH